MTELSSVSGLRGVREQIAKVLSDKRDEVKFDVTFGREFRLSANDLADAILEALSLPLSPQPPELTGKTIRDAVYVCSGYDPRLITSETWDRIALKLNELLRSAPAGAQGQVQGVQALMTEPEFGRKVSAYARDIIARSGYGIFVGDGDWQDVSEVAVTLLRLGGELRLAAAPSAGSGQEGLRELLLRHGFVRVMCGFDGGFYYQCKECKAYPNNHTHPESTPELAKHIDGCKLAAALLPPAPKPAPPAEPSNIEALAELVNTLEQAADSVWGIMEFRQKIQPLKDELAKVRRASLERESK